MSLLVLGEIFIQALVFVQKYQIETVFATVPEGYLLNNQQKYTPKIMYLAIMRELEQYIL